MAWQPRKFEVEAELPVPRDEAWELLANTDRINRAVGLSPVEFDPNPRGGSASIREARGKAAGLLPMRWKEYPFQWVQGESYSVLRLYDGGPLARFLGGMELSDAGPTASRLRLYADITPANWLGAILVPVVATRTMRKTLTYCMGRIAAGHVVPVIMPTAIHSPVRQTVLDGLIERLQQDPVDKSYVARLRRHLMERGDDEVAAMQPYHLAQEWRAVPDEVLRLCLYATKAGLLNLSWNLMCPNCRVPANRAGSLHDVSEQFHCDFCGVSYGADFDRFVELRVGVHPNVRPAVAQTYCIGGPFMAPHILVQQAIPAGETVSVTFPDVPEEVRLRVLRAPHGIAFEEGTVHAARHEFEYSDDGWNPVHTPRPAPGTELSLVNRSSGDVMIALEKVEWDPLAVTALKVTSMQEFRDLFSSEVLAPGHHVSVENLTLFFSDLRGSTEMYEMAGDAPAYGRVRRHFDFMYEIIAANSGSIVKTIGDAVMAVFYSPEDAVRAALAIQKEVAAFNAALPEGDDLVIKIGLHFGPAIAVNSNDKLDYFGRTVNIAARTQGTSIGDDIVMTGAIHSRPGVATILGKEQLQSEAFVTVLKGIEGDIELHRIRLHKST